MDRRMIDQDLEELYELEQKSNNIRLRKGLIEQGREDILLPLQDENHGT